MIALPFHPSNAFAIRELKTDLMDILRETEKEALKQIDNSGLKYCLTDKVVEGKLKVDQGVIAGCAGGTFENIVYAAALLKGHSIGNEEFSLSVYPASQPILIELTRKGMLESLLESGATMRTAFCGPCFGAGMCRRTRGSAFAIRRATSQIARAPRPQDGQIASVALMDARSIAATALNQGFLTGADEISFHPRRARYHFRQTSTKTGSIRATEKRNPISPCASGRTSWIGPPCPRCRIISA